MPIAPIQQYQDPSNSLMQILQGGNQQIGSILDRAIQIGRDIANKRTQQEQDLAAMRNQETAMAQRRGENLQSVLETQRKFGMEQDKFDFLRMDTQRKYDANRTDEATRAAERAAAMGQQQSQFEQNYGLSERRVAVDEATAKRQADAVAAEQQRLEAAATPPPSGETTSSVLAPPPTSTTPGLPGGVPWRREATDRAFAGGELLTPQNDTGIPWGNPYSAFPAKDGPAAAPGIPELLARPDKAASPLAESRIDPASLKLDIRDAEKGLAAAERLGDRTRIEGWKSKLKDLYTKEAGLTKSETPAEQRAQARFEAWQQDRAKGDTAPEPLAPARAQAGTAGTALKQVVEGVPDAFMNPYGEAFAPSKETPSSMAIRKAKAKQWEANPDAGERQAALTMTRKVYADKFYKGGFTPEEILRLRSAREKVWDLAQSEKSAQGTLMGGAPAATESPVDLLKRQH